MYYVSFQSHGCSSKIKSDIFPLSKIGIKNTLQKLENSNFCSGIRNSELQRFAEIQDASCLYFKQVEENTLQSVVYSSKCEILSQSQLCKQCTYILKLLVQKHKRSLASVQKGSDKIHPNTPLQVLSKKQLANAIKSQRKTIKKFKKEIDILKKKMKNDYVTIKDSFHDELCNLMKSEVSEPKSDTFIKLFWEEQCEMFKRNPKGICSYNLFIIFLGHEASL